MNMNTFTFFILAILTVAATSFFIQNLNVLLFGWHFVSPEEYQKLIANQSRPDLNISADRKTELVFHDGAPNVPLGYCYPTPKEKEMFSWPPPQEDIDSVLNGHWECMDHLYKLSWYEISHFECVHQVWVKDGD